MKITDTTHLEYKNIIRTYEIKDDFVGISATVHAQLETKEIDISEIEIAFLIKGKYVKRSIFKECYEKLFGENTFSNYDDEINGFVEMIFMDEFNENKF